MLCKQYIEELALFHNKAIENSKCEIGHVQAEYSTFCTPGITDAYRYVVKIYVFYLCCYIFCGKHVFLLFPCILCWLYGWLNNTQYVTKNLIYNLYTHNCVSETHQFLKHFSVPPRVVLPKLLYLWKENNAVNSLISTHFVPQLEVFGIWEVSFSCFNLTGNRFSETWWPYKPMVNKLSWMEIVVLCDSIIF